MPDTGAIYEIFKTHPAVCTDSRKVTTGSMFFALKGDNFDGNKYAAQALESGAAYAVVDDPGVAVSERFIVVEDVLKTLQALARHHRRELRIPIIAITGSNGKTTTKELTNRVLQGKYNVSVTQGNLNNHIGVPLTLLSMTGETQIGIVEMGANHQGEIALLCSIAEPDYGLITNVGHSHLEGFGGFEGVIKGKGEMFDYLEKTGGTAFYLTDSPELTRMAKERPSLKTIPYTITGYSDATHGGTCVSFKYEGMRVVTSMIGWYNIFNIAAAIAIGVHFKISVQGITMAMSDYSPNNARSERKVSGSNVLYLDCYNANPSSMYMALSNFADAKEPGYKKVVILGDMGELGMFADMQHKAVLEHLEEYKFDEVYLVGAIFSRLAANSCYKTFNFVGELCDYLKEHPISKSVVFIKGSRSARLEKTESFLHGF